jgi:hypothetical protein
MAHYAETDYTVTAELTEEARNLFTSMYCPAKHGSTFTSFDELRAHKFLNNNSTSLSKLPPTEDAFYLHVKRASYVTIIDKTAHIAKPELPSPQDYGWTMDGDVFSPIPMTKPAWPKDRSRGVSCGCLTLCKRNCSCGKKALPCFIGCICKGKPDTCNRARCALQLATNSDHSSDDSNSED